MKREDFKKPTHEELEQMYEEAIEDLEDMIDRLTLLKNEWRTKFYGHIGYGFDDDDDDDDDD